MAMTVRDICANADLFRAAYPDWPSARLPGVPMSARDLTDYPEALDEPLPEGKPSGTALRMAALLREGR